MATTSYRAVGGCVGDFCLTSTGASSTWSWATSSMMRGYKSYRGPIHLVCKITRDSATYGVRCEFDCETFASITDGTSNCLMFTEHHNDKDTKTMYATRGTMWMGHAENMIANIHNSLRQMLRTHRVQECIDSGIPAYQAWKGIGAWHPGGINAALCDGSVRFVPETVNLTLLGNYARIQSGETKESL